MRPKELLNQLRDRLQDNLRDNDENTKRHLDKLAELHAEKKKLLIDIADTARVIEIVRFALEGKTAKPHNIANLDGVNTYSGERGEDRAAADRS